MAEVEAELAVLAEQSEEDALRCLVSENDLDRVEASESRKHAVAARREAETLREEIALLELQLDDLLDSRS